MPKREKAGKTDKIEEKKVEKMGQTVKTGENKKFKIAVLASGRGSNLQAILDQIEAGLLPAEVVLVLSDKPDCQALERGLAHGAKTKVLEPAAYSSREAYDGALAAAVLQSGAQLVVLAGFMRILGHFFLKEFPNKVINIHPALLPAFPGLHGQRQAFEYGVKVSGCTVHIVDEGMDSGPIIAQKAVDISHCQNDDEVAATILKEEHKLYPQVVGYFAQGRVELKAGKVTIKNEGGLDSMKKRAILSVSDKTGIVELAKELVALGYEIVSTGGTYKTIQGEGVPATYVTEITGFPEILGGRVKTLHPFVHGGILAMRTEEHLTQLAKQGIVPIDLVVVNLYPFRQTIAKPGVTLEDAIENIDIGGPSMVRAAAKNNQYVTVVVNPEHYGDIVAMLKEKGEVDRETRLQLAAEAFTHTAEYDAYISAYLKKQVAEQPGYPETMLLAGEKLQDLRYGENPHQSAAFYRQPGVLGACVANARQLQGKELSFNNIVDLNAALELVREFDQPAAVVMKHTNPCGAALGKDIGEAYRRAYDADSLSAYGGIVGLNREVDKTTAEAMSKTFLEAVIAPSFSGEAREILSAKKNLRLLEVGELSHAAADAMDVKKVSGGFLVQSADQVRMKAADLMTVTKIAPSVEDIEELLFAFTIVKHVKSNAIVITKDRCTLGVGAGQMNRVGSAGIAMAQGGEACRGAVLASDAYFPFRDTIDAAAQAGIRAVIQPGGSIRDEESVAACDEHGIAMVMTRIRHFKH